MPITEEYEAILTELAEGELEELEVKVFHALRRVYPQSRTRAGLLLDVYGYEVAPGENLNNNHKDRKIREAVASLFSKGIPIVSTSGEAGYCIDIDQDHWAEMLMELQRRRDSLSERIDAAKRIQRKITEVRLNAIPPTVPPTPKQLSFEEVR